MAITYTKYIYSLNCYPEIDGQKDVVFKIQWQLNGTEDALSETIPCITEVPYTAGQSFIPYADLTQEQVISWIDEYTSEEQMVYWKKSIEESIQKRKQIINPPLPWQPPLEETPTELPQN